VFEYTGHSMVGSGGTNLDLNGQVIAASKHNVKAPVFDDRHDMLAYPHATTCSMNGSLMHGVEADPSKTSGDDHKFVRTSGIPTTDDLRDFDQSRFELAMNNTPDTLFNKEVGQLFVYYTVKLMKPRLQAGRGSAISTFRQVCKDPPALTPWGLTTGGTDTTTALTCSRNSLDMSYVSGSRTGTWTFPSHAVGLYQCTFSLEGANLDANEVAIGNLTTAGEIVNFTNEFLDAGGAYDSKMSYADGTGYRCKLIAYVRVKPQVGATKNTLSCAVGNGDASDDVQWSSVVIQEINDFAIVGSGLKIPEYLRVDTLVAASA